MSLYDPVMNVKRGTPSPLHNFSMQFLSFPTATSAHAPYPRCASTIQEREVNTPPLSHRGGAFFVLKEEIEQVGTLDEYLAKVEGGEIRP